VHLPVQFGILLLIAHNLQQLLYFAAAAYPGLLYVLHLRGAKKELFLKVLKTVFHFRNFLEHNRRDWRRRRGRRRRRRNLLRKFFFYLTHYIALHQLYFIVQRGHLLNDRGPRLPQVGPGVDMPIYAASPNPLTRTLIERPFSTGVRAIDSVMTAGEGQRVGIFAVAGGGKSTLLGMLARGGDADVNVIVLVGERGREVSEFIHDNLGDKGLAKSVLVVATSDRPALERSRAAWVGTAIAEHFRDQGKRVLLLLDSVTRFARALRDVGLAIGEPPARRGFPPSVFSALPRLFERAGNNDKGSITAFYTVLAEDEDGGDPIVEEVRSILDGHIVLSRKLAAAYHYPAIDVLTSLSRTMPRVVDQAHLRAAGQLRKALAKHQDIELLLQLGEYKRGSDPDADFAIDRIGPIRKLLQQGSAELVPFAQSSDTLKKLFA